MCRGRTRARGGRASGAGALGGLVGVLAGVVVVLGTSASVAAADVTSRFVPVTPTRVADTRPGEGPTDDGLEGLVPAGGTVRVQVARPLGVPAVSMVAVVLGVTITEATGVGYVQVLPGDAGTLGGSSNLNVDAPGDTIANQVTVPVGADGSVRILTQGGGHLVVDVFGWFTPSGATDAGRYAPLAPPTPRRVLDTRDTGVPLSPGGTVRVPVSTGSDLGGGVVAPGQASAVVVNLTVTESSGPGYWQAVPTAGATPFGASSNVNVTRAGQTIATQAIVPLGADGTITVFSQRGGHLVVDIAGVFTGDAAPSSTIGLFVPMVPQRLLDTREAALTPVPGPLRPGAAVDVVAGGRAGVPSTASAVAANVTLVAAEPGYVQLLPTPSGTTASGPSSVVNAERPTQVIANAAFAGLGDRSSLRLVTQRGGELIVDVAGWFTGGSVATPRFAFVGTYNVGESPPTSPGISTFVVDPDTGALSFRSVVATSSPAFVVVHPSLRMVYVVNEIAPQGRLEAYRYDASTGALTLVGSRDVGSNPTHLEIDPRGRWVVVANYSSGTWQVVALGADGSLGAVTDTELRVGSGPNFRQASSHPHGSAWDPSGTYLVGADLGTDVVEVFTISADGRLTTVDTAASVPGSGPRHVAFAPNGRFLYVVEELTGTVSVYPFDPANGRLGVPVQRAALMPPDVTNGWSGAEIVVHPSGGLLYVSHRGYVSHPLVDSVVRFRVDPATGLLTRLGWTTAGLSEVRSMSFDPTGTWLYALNLRTDSIVQFRVDRTTGDLEAVGQPTSSPVPSSIAFVR